MFGLGVHELMIVGVIAVLLFGRKLPEVARSLGMSYREFRKGLNEFQSQVNVDSYNSPSYSRPRSYRDDEDYADTATAPKFEPPTSEPQASDDSAAAETPAEEGGPAESTGDERSTS